MYLQCTVYTVPAMASLIGSAANTYRRYSFPISVLISISSITEYVSPPSICIAFPRIDAVHQILFRYHFHKQPLIPDGHMVSGVRTPLILGRDQREV